VLPLSALDTFWDRFLAALAPLLATGVAAVFAWLWWRLKLRLERINTPPTFEQSHRTDQRITTLLAEARTITGADRCYVAGYHNGTRLIGPAEDGYHLLKKSRTHEVVGPGVEPSVGPEVNDYKDLYVSLIPEEYELVVEDGPSWRVVEDIDDSKFKRMLMNSGVWAVARCAIRRGGEIVGFVGADFNHRRAKPANMDALVDYAGRIEQVMGEPRRH
jgi:hypothetical protein